MADDLASTSISKTRRAATDYDIAPQVRKDRPPIQKDMRRRLPEATGNPHAMSELALGIYLS